ncbi:MAG: 3-dehydroquinate synthase [Pseudomonadota bacterium]|nr:3-dehydroquinate synthase [Pseudomonadota bacterium]
MSIIEVRLDERSYPVHVEAGLLARSDLIGAAMSGRHVLIVSNETVAPLYLSRILNALNSHEASSFLLADGESHKTLENVGKVMTQLAQLGVSRDATIVALGGGVVGDLAGFCAALWMRGISFVQIPTTLLAMVDSSVGGKTGVNLPQGKNLVGAFHQPRAVFIDPATLSTLPERELLAGLAEVIKYAAIGDGSFMDWLEVHADALLAREANALQFSIETSVRHKARVVQADEHERGERALLNFGHTFGHALEAATGYQRFLHGEAVAIGMLTAARLSTALGMAASQDADRLQSLLQRIGLPTRIPDDLGAAELLALMQLDKKVESGKLRLILWRGIGRAQIVAGVSDADIRATLQGMH